MTTIDPATIRQRADIVYQRILDGGGDLSKVRVMAVTKGFGTEVVTAAIEAGLDLLGESYVQEFVTKLSDMSSELAATPSWHFIGRLQRNKVRSLPTQVDVIQSVDRRSLATEVSLRRPGQRILVQVNISNEPQKGGCEPDETSELVSYCRDAGLDVDGLMGVASPSPDDEVLAQFTSLRRLADDLQLRERSMGMTADMDLALAAGSTMVRVGSAIFGPRPPR